MLKKRKKQQIKKGDLFFSSYFNFSNVSLRWLEVMEKYESGAFMYYTTLPTDALAAFRDSALETEQFGFEEARKQMWNLGNRGREITEKKQEKRKNRRIWINIQSSPFFSFLCFFFLSFLVRQELEKRGFQSVAAEGYKAPGVVVVYSPYADMVRERKKKEKEKRENKKRKKREGGIEKKPKKRRKTEKGQRK